MSKASSVVASVTQQSTVWVKKNPPQGVLTFLIFLTNGWEFLIDFYTPITRSYLRQTTNFYSIISNFDEVMPY